MKVSGEFIRYCLVGGINTLAGISTAYIVLNHLSQTYFVATACAYIVGICVSFTLNKVFTFKYCERVNCWILFLKFVLTMLPSYIVSYYLGWACSKVFITIPVLYSSALKIARILAVSEDKLSDNIAILVSMGIYLLLGFVVNKYFVFKKK